MNQHYRAGEMRALLSYVGVRAVVYHRRFGPLVAEAGDTSDLVLVDVDDGSGVPPLASSTNFEVVADTRVDGALPVPSPDDLYLVCTGGTTGEPKAVLWRQADAYVSAMSGADGATAESIASAAVASPACPWFAMRPLMHAASQWTAFSGLHSGAPLVLHDDSSQFDAAHVLELIERERVYLMSMVGDAHGRPIVEALQTGSYEASGLRVLATGGAVTSNRLKEALPRDRVQSRFRRNRGVRRPVACARTRIGRDRLDCAAGTGAARVSR